MADSRAGYWCRRTADLVKVVAVASREAREAKEMVRVVQEAHGQHAKEMNRVVQAAHDRQLQQAQEQMVEVRRLLSTSLEQSGRQQRDTAQAVQEASGQQHKRFQRMQEQMEELKQLLTTSLTQGVQERAPPIRVHRGTQVLVAQEHAADAQELQAPSMQQGSPAQVAAVDTQQERAADVQEPSAPLVQRSSPVQVAEADAQGELVVVQEHVADTQELLAPLVEAAKRIQAAIRGRYEFVQVALRYHTRDLTTGHERSGGRTDLCYRCHVRRLHYLYQMGRRINSYGCVNCGYCAETRTERIATAFVASSGLEFATEWFWSADRSVEVLLR